ncbi:penicillin-binding protein 1A [Mucilaginibacter gracilis]|uniref:Penicillin-binding protein 1A n=1 Tax=Mucilaginibacter gracilis TaxID=423350 RepID=A0A495IY76_9SPHI|nr:transglycosylase domain-containing protein [Mucilaginibacter gracilis]RKR81666.1 penicillin-binding protein 1A [Mucilaginibacter gracilis]
MWIKTENNKLTPQDIRRYNWFVWKFIGACFAFVVIIILLTAFEIFGKLPSFRDLENPKSNQATIVLSSDKQELGTYYVENRSNVNYKDISPNVINALVATEDKRFYDHSGIDFSRIFTIFIHNLFGSKQGGSTITQQLALNLFSEKGREHSFIKRLPQKLKELITAVRIERRYTKEEIITMYLNTVDFGAYSTFGIKSAARTYFNTTPDKLSPDQAALLVGILNGTGKYSPIRHPDKALARRNLVLTRMAEAGYLSSGQADEFKLKPLNLDFRPVDHNEGLATYFRDYLKRDVQKIFEEKSIDNNGKPYDLDRDGLKIYTTINATMQEYAEEAQKEYMRILQNQFNQHWKGISLWKSIPTFKALLDAGMRRSDRYRELRAEGKSDEEIKADFNTPTKMNIFTWKGDIDTTMKPIDSIVYCKMLLRNSLMSMDPTTGYVKAWVGGINFEHFKYDQVKQGMRQVGSTAKPFTYAVAIENGYSPCMVIPNVPVTFPDGYTPASGDTRAGDLTLRQALGWSQNWITAALLKEVGVPAVVELTKKMGITSQIEPYPSVFLGPFDASVFDMTGAYSAFVNHGLWTEPTYLLRIEDHNGNVLYENKPKVAQVLNEQTAYVMTYMLKGVIEDGTGTRLKYRYGLNNPIGGKTGTTQNNSDGWFIGITPQLVTGVWTGCEDRDIHFRSTSLGEGANSALPIFAMYMKRVYANTDLGIKKNVDFDQPKTPLTITLDCNAYQPGTTEADKKLNF